LVGIGNVAFLFIDDLKTIAANKTKQNKTKQTNKTTQEYRQDPNTAFLNPYFIYQGS